MPNGWQYVTLSLIFVCLLLFYAIAIVFQIYHGSDIMNETRRRKPKSTLLPTQWTFNLPHHIGMVSEELAFDDIWYITHSVEMDCRTAKRYSSDLDSYPYLQGHLLRVLTMWAIYLPTPLLSLMLSLFTISLMRSICLSNNMAPCLRVSAEVSPTLVIKGNICDSTHMPFKRSRTVKRCWRLGLLCRQAVGHGTRFYVFTAP